MSDSDTDLNYFLEDGADQGIGLGAGSQDQEREMLLHMSPYQRAQHVWSKAVDSDTAEYYADAHRNMKDANYIQGQDRDISWVLKHMTFPTAKIMIDAALDKANKAKAEKEKVTKQKSGAVVLYESPKVVVRRIYTHAASAIYGLGTKWCVVMKANPSHWNSYTSAGKRFVFCESKLPEFPPSHAWHKIALEIFARNNGEKLQFQAWVSTDAQVFSANNASRNPDAEYNRYLGRWLWTHGVPLTIFDEDTLGGEGEVTNSRYDRS